MIYNAWLDECTYIRSHEEYLKLGNNAQERCYRYRELFKINLSEQDLHAIRKAAHYCLPLGDDRFVEQIEEKLGYRVGQSKRGRPKKNIGRSG